MAKRLIISCGETFFFHLVRWRRLISVEHDVGGSFPFPLLDLLSGALLLLDVLLDENESPESSSENSLGAPIRWANTKLIIQREKLTEKYGEKGLKFFFYLSEYISGVLILPSRPPGTRDHISGGQIVSVESD